jgi:REP element-mobilizing transposase RayT
MLIQPFRLEELRFAYCNRVFFRTCSHRRKRIESLANLTVEAIQPHLDSYNIHALEFESTESEIQGLLSLQPTDSIAAAMSKAKGRISKWLTEHQSLEAPHAKQKHLAVGYFALTVGQSNAAAIDDYLNKQSEHHGYPRRVRPPIYVRSIDHSESELIALQADHAVTKLRYHLVLATEYRRGVFTDDASQQVTEQWLKQQAKFTLDKVSFLPDHVHIATSIHPSMAPAAVAEVLMNSAQELIWNRFPSLAVKARIERLWQPSGYIGSFGNLSSPAVKAYMRNWAESQSKD